AGELEEAGYAVEQLQGGALPGEGMTIVVGEWDDSLATEASGRAGLELGTSPGKEGYAIRSAEQLIVIRGSDASGALYGCLDLAGKIGEQKELPRGLELTEAPEMVMRGSCIGMQKTVYLPGRKVYEYPYT